MQLGFSSYTFPWAVGVTGYQPHNAMTIPHLIEQCHYFGINRLQLCDNISFDTLPNPEDIAHIQIEIGTRRLVKENLLKHLDICKKYNAPFLRVVIDDADFHPTEQEVIAIIHSVLPAFQQAKVILAIENHDRFSVDSLIRIIEATDRDFVGICLDTANSLGAGEGIKEVVKGLAPYTINLHIKDFTISRLNHKMGFVVEGCSAGKGMLNIPFVLETLKPYNRCISATLEVWSSPLSTLEETIQQEKMWIHDSTTFLKTFF